MRPFKKIIDFLVFSNVIVATPITCMAYETYLIAGASPDTPLLCFIYFASLLLYGFHRIHGLFDIDIELYSTRHHWARRRYSWMVGVLAIALTGTLVSVYFLERSLLLALIPAALISVAYSVPALPLGQRTMRLRDIPMVKIFLIAGVVSYVTVMLPFLTFPSGNDLVSADLWMLVISRFFFLLAITIPFDIRDVRFDREWGVQTMPLKYGIKKAKRIALVFLFLFLGVAGMHYLLGTWMSLPILMALAASLLATVPVILQASPKRSEYYYSLVLEGTMVVQFALVYGSVVWLSDLL